MEVGLLEVLAHERSLMLAIVAHLPFSSLVIMIFLIICCISMLMLMLAIVAHLPCSSLVIMTFLIRGCISSLLDQVALESASSQIYQLFSSHGWFPSLFKCQITKHCRCMEGCVSRFAFIHKSSKLSKCKVLTRYFRCVEGCVSCFVFCPT